MRRYLGLMMCGWMCLGLTATAAVTNYVWDGGTDSTPYTSWATAAHTIADAVAAASVGDTVLVTNGTYVLTSQIEITKAITVQSVNGRDVTFVDGNYPAVTNRCFEITGDATLAGFTITNGLSMGIAPTNSGGGIYAHDCSVTIRDCDVSQNSACLEAGDGGVGGGMSLVSATIDISGCLVARNSVDPFSSSSTPDSAAGIYIKTCAGLMNDCVISNNVMQAGGNGTGAGIVLSGSSGTVVSNCTMVANWSSRYAGNFVDYGTFTHCLFLGNHAATAGGGLTMNNYGANVYNCTVVSNTCGTGGGAGVSAGRGNMHNTIISYNHAGNKGAVSVLASA